MEESLANPSVAFDVVWIFGIGEASLSDRLQPLGQVQHRKSAVLT